MTIYLQEKQGLASMGYQYICQGSTPATIENGRYDFVMCLHVIKHIANPLKASGTGRGLCVQFKLDKVI